jgi:hypothetical protein
MFAGCSRFCAVLAALAFGTACSADSLTPPEPALERPGSFVAATDDDGVIFLTRTLRVVALDGEETALEASIYGGAPSSYDEARAWAKEPSLPIASPHAIFSLSVFLTLEPEVVWFRTLTENELSALR